MRTKMVAAMIIAAVMLAVPCDGFWYQVFPAGADGDMNCYPEEGYSIAAAGTLRLSKFRQQFAFMGFNVPGDGEDGISWARPGDTGDGVMLYDWLIGKKAFQTTLYLRDATSQTCDPSVPSGTYINDPVAVIGFRISNLGPFADRGYDGSGDFTGCCAPYESPKVVAGMSTAIAWRIGPAPYSQRGDAGSGAEWYSISSADTTSPLLVLMAGSWPFDPDGDGFGGYSGPLDGAELRIEDNMFAFAWLLAHSDAHFINSEPLDTADCAGPYGGEEPRDAAKDLWFGEGWYGVPLDRRIVQAMAWDPECKGLVFSSAAVNNGRNTAFFSRDQMSNTDGPYTPYLHVTATYAGDCNNDGAVDVVDLLYMVDSFGLVEGDFSFNPECDANCDSSVDVYDLLTLVENFGQPY